MENRGFVYGRVSGESTKRVRKYWSRIDTNLSVLISGTDHTDQPLLSLIQVARCHFRIL